jgi:hypothetical protein
MKSYFETTPLRQCEEIKMKESRWSRDIPSAILDKINFSKLCLLTKVHSVDVLHREILFEISYL